MKALLIRMASATLALGILFYFPACSPPAPNNNTSQNQNLSPNQNKANGNVAPMDLGRCRDYGAEPGGPPAHAQNLKNGIKDKMDSKLKSLYKDPDNPRGTFTIDIQKAEDGRYFVAYVRGKVSGDDNLKKLSNILNDFQNDEECLRVVYFLREQSPSGAAAAAQDGFEWSSCQYPKVVCGSGECCDAKSNTNTNTGNPVPGGNRNTSNTNRNVNTP